MLRFFDRANAATLAGLGAAFVAMILALNGHAPYALAALIMAGLCDLFDGLIARTLPRSEEGQMFGARLDSVVDACSFGFAPTVVLYQLGLRSPAECVLLFGMAAAVVWRLAYFDTVGLHNEPGNGSSQRRFYSGLPCTYVALAIPLAGLAGFHSSASLELACVLVVAGLSMAMVSRIPIPKPDRWWYVFFLIAAISASGLFIGQAENFNS